MAGCTDAVDLNSFFTGLLIGIVFSTQVIRLGPQKYSLSCPQHWVLKAMFSAMLLPVPHPRNRLVKKKKIDSKTVISLQHY